MAFINAQITESLSKEVNEIIDLIKENGFDPNIQGRSDLLRAAIKEFNDRIKRKVKK